MGEFIVVKKNITTSCCSFENEESEGLALTAVLYSTIVPGVTI